MRGNGGGSRGSGEVMPVSGRSSHVMRRSGVSGTMDTLEKESGDMRAVGGEVGSTSEGTRGGSLMDAVRASKRARRARMDASWGSGRRGVSEQRKMTRRPPT